MHNACDQYHKLECKGKFEKLHCKCNGGYVTRACVVYKSKMLGMYNVKKLCWFARELTHINAHVYEMYLCFKSCHCYYLYMSTKCSMCFIFKARQVFPHFLFNVCDHGGALSSIPRSKLLSTRCAPADQLTPLLELLAPLS